MMRVRNVLIIFVIFCLGLSLSQGSISLRDLLSLFEEDFQLALNIITKIRLPRTLTAFIVGGGLGLAGAAMQSLLRNPLSDPSILGISSCAAVGGSLSILTGLTGLHFLFTPISAMIGCGVGLLFLWFLTRLKQTNLSLILGGMALNTLSGALLMFLFSLGKGPYDFMELIFWLMGSFDHATWYDLLPLSLIFFLGVTMILRCGKALDYLSLGSDVAKSLGIAPLAVTRSIFIGVALITGTTVSLSGIIGFVGLITPHLIRNFSQNLPSKTCINSFFAGGALTLVSDLILRMIPLFDKVQIGVFTALTGAPLFLYMYLKEQQKDD